MNHDDGIVRRYMVWLDKHRKHMTELEDARATVDHDVKTWYAHPAYWGPQNKQPEWPDRVLSDQGEFFRGKDVLNLGCFYPEDEEAFAPLSNSWIGLDFVPEVIARCREIIRAKQIQPVEFVVGDMRELRYADNVFDVVTDFSSGDHLLKEDWLRVVDEVFRVLRPGGHFLVCFANNEAFVALFGESWRERPAQSGEYGYVRTDTVAEMQAMLEAAGFEIVRKSHDNAGQLRTGMLARKP